MTTLHWSFYIALICISYVVNQRTDNAKAIVGIITNPEPYNTNDPKSQSTIFFNYVAWLESFGIKVVPVLYNYDEDTLNDLLSKVNGLLFQGGSRDLSKDGLFEAISKSILEKANRLQIPVWFTCQGFELLYFILGDKQDDVLEKFSAYSYNLPIYPNQNAFNSRMFKQFSNLDYQRLMNKDDPGTIHYHNLGVSPSTHAKYPKLSDALTITSTGFDLNGAEFVSSVESRDFNTSKLFAVIFHPEKAGVTKSAGEFKHTTINTLIINKLIGLGYLEEVLKSRAKISMSEEDQTRYGILISSERKLPESSTEYLFDLKTPSHPEFLSRP